MLNLRNVSIYQHSQPRATTRSLQRRINYIGHDVQAFGITGMTETSLWEWLIRTTRRVKSDYLISPDPILIVLFYSSRKAAATICRKNVLDNRSKKRFVISHLVLRMFESSVSATANGHSNLLLFDHKKKEVYVFEPHGPAYVGIKRKLVQSVVHEQLSTMCEHIGYNYKGVAWNSCRLQKDHFGSCFMWSSLFLWFCVHSKLSPPNVMKSIIQIMHKHNIGLRNMLDLFVDHVYNHSKIKGTAAKEQFQGIRTYIVSTYNNPTFRTFVEDLPNHYKIKVKGTNDVYVLKNISPKYFTKEGYVHWNFDQYTKIF